MPTTYRESIVVAALAKLAAISSVADLVVERNRVEAVETFPMIVLREGGHEVSEETSSHDLATISLDVELYVRSTSAAINVGTLLNELYGAAKVALQADRSLGIGAFDVRETSMSAPTFDTSDAAHPQASAVVSFDVQFWQTKANPY